MRILRYYFALLSVRAATRVIRVLTRTLARLNTFAEASAEGETTAALLARRGDTLNTIGDLTALARNSGAVQVEIERDSFHITLTPIRREPALAA